MPKTKRFEAMKLTIPFEIIHLDMFDMLKEHTQLIKQLFETIDQDKEPGYTASVEIPEDDSIYHIWKEDDGETFVIRQILGDGGKQEEKRYSPVEFYNWCFAKAPFMSMVGTGLNR